jgi:hypothetical protein
MIPFAGTRLKGLALAALLAFLGTSTESALLHTDDGCPVEIHCLACRLALGTTAVAPPPEPVLAIALVERGAPPEVRHSRATRYVGRTLPTRGPPSA